ncbi:hypothetical protein KKF34_16890 [Myxococcota bacterium]|nr:hypothetical protein [Myxococcota bacterium]MBU1381989.1 hypothetical protein [Myxococcota bacterium]MBU1498556.1 hypothetical protein [Myxococcota bacterium]
MRKFISLFVGVLFVAGCGGGSSQDYNNYIDADGGIYSETFTGGEYHLGPVEWDGEWNNSCSPYPTKIRQIEGIYLAGLELTHNGNGQLCDTCIRIETEQGKSLTLRVVTTGYTTPNSIDVSSEAYEVLNSGEYPRNMSWYVTKCPDNGENIYYQFQTGANVWWTSLWVRNIALPLESVEVRSTNHADWYALTRGNDGTYTDNGGFGEGPFTIRLTSIDGQIIEDSFDSFTPGSLVESSSQFE